MEDGTSKDVLRFFRIIISDQVNDIDKFCNACSKRGCKIYINNKEVM